MVQLLQSFSGQQIILFIILFCISIKEIFEFVDWIKHRKNNFLLTEGEKKKYNTTIQERLQLSEQRYLEQQKRTENIEKQLALLISSDKDDIKAWITEKHHDLCYNKKYIDDYTLDCIERRYAHYIEEGGNSYIDNLVKEIRQLEKQTD